MINNFYLSQLELLSKAFSRNKQFPHVMLYEFFEVDWYRQLKTDSSGLHFKKSRQPWSHSYAQANLPVLLKNYLHSPEFRRMVFSITGRKIKSFSAHVYQYAQGDYLILNDLAREEHHAEFILDLTDNWSWQWGGYVSYTNGQGDVLPLPISGNTVTIIEKRHHVNRFVKYVNHHAENNRTVFCLAKLTFI